MDLAEAVMTVVGVLRGIDDVTQFDESAGEVVVHGAFFEVDGVSRRAFQAMLTDDEGASFAGGKAFGDQEDAIGEDLGIDIQLDFVAGPGGFVIDFAGAGFEGQGGRGQFAEDFAVEVVAIEIAGFLPGFGGSGIGAVPELASDGLAVAPEFLDVGEQLTEEAAVAFVRVAAFWVALGVGGNVVVEEGESVA